MVHIHRVAQLSYPVEMSCRAAQPASIDIKVTAASHPIINAFHGSLTEDTYKPHRYEAPYILTSTRDTD